MSRLKQMRGVQSSTFCDVYEVSVEPLPSPEIETWAFAMSAEAPW